MITHRALYSEVINEVRAVNIDAFLPPKYVLSKAKDILGDFLKKSDSTINSLYKLSEGWLQIEGLALEVVPVTTCNLSIQVCQKLMRTKDKLPATFSSSAGNLLKEVASLDFSSFYEPTTPKNWKDIQKRKDKSSKKYYFIIDEHIYIPIPIGSQDSPESIRLEGIFYNPWELEPLKINCPTCKQNKCKPWLDYDFPSPEYLINDVKQECIKQLSQVYLKVVAGQYPNNNDIDKNTPQEK